ncbi:MAG TPA: methylamine dehydrogenase accessory protein MauD [Candidatus Binataceae bacterium]|nr:methylamine dehydrogenase accessory protein MauD [Candidatus Binataceae bacterium]
MPQAIVISQIVLWILLLVMAGIQLALLRQIGVLHERIAPLGALTIDTGPKEGAAAPVFELSDLRGGRVAIGAPSERGLDTLVFFLSPTCPVCKKMLPILKSLRAAEEKSLRIVLASDGERDEHERFVAAHKLGDFPYLLSQELGMTYRVAKLPYAVLIDRAGVVRAKGLINSREHLESLLEAKERGVASIQEFMHAAHPHPGPPSAPAR